ncbi:cyclodeaminase/cyclohydrolase family protein [Tissierella carlieri]|uniref:Cyclodeaminase/cyclohydrolase family protein n=1 Tax=Tissierella carlieri TaxID=689904 RepID=A0ABT1SDV1_9FIRM|nr:cyclodeaminase/cyclohydrolase family protein [Tissierella carlieri]MCQ4924668.1 cyclodeaminase/cyclohydrolase family protein [Tissierella carlieri]
MFIDKSLKEYIAATASGEPTPGGGSVAALVGSLGGALTNMVNNLTVGKKVYEELSDEIKSEIAQNSKEVEKLVQELSSIVDEDTKAFDKVMEAFKLPKETDEEKATRTKAIQEGYKVALEVPLRCAEKCLRILELQEVFANYGNVNAITDVGVGTLLAYSGLEGALFNVTINLGSIKDEEFKKDISAKVNTLLNEGKKLKEKLLDIVYKRLG